MDTKVTLRKFLEVTYNLIDPDLCIVVVEKKHELYGLISEQIKFNGSLYLKDIKNLDQYLDYEIYNFEQRFFYGELDEQVLWLRKI